MRKIPSIVEVMRENERVIADGMQELIRVLMQALSVREPRT